MVLNLPNPALIALVGVTGSGKTSFAARHFRPTEVVSSDHCRGLVSDDPTDQGVNDQAFRVVHAIADARLELGKLVVVDATHVQPESRAPLVELARRHDLFAVAVVLDVPLRVCEDRTAARPDRPIGKHVVRNQHLALRRSVRALKAEGFKQVWTLKPHEIENVEVRRTPLWTDRRSELGPFDIIGDVHGCAAELHTLLGRLGYLAPDPAGLPVHPAGRRLIFLGDLVDRGPDSVGVVDLVRRLVGAGSAFCVAGNHDEKFLRYLRGKDVRINHGLEKTVAQVAALPTEGRVRFEAEARRFLDGLVSHYVLDGGKLVVAHAGMKREYQGRSSPRVRSYALYGDTTGEVDSFGLPVRHRWAEDYRGAALVVYGHTPVRTPERLHGTINIDTGCCFGGGLTALRYPEGELVTVAAEATYAEAVRPFLDDAPVSQGRSADPDRATAGPSRPAGVAGLQFGDVAGKRILTTRLMGKLTIPAEPSAPALELLSRFAVDPRWLIYLPPTMAPCASAPAGPFLEHPATAFDHYRAAGVETVVCQAKHMGSRAVLVVVRDPEVAVTRFGLDEPAPGVMITRTGRRFWSDPAVEVALLHRVARAIEVVGLWAELDADWVVLDAELMPWNAKAATLVRDQYAPVGAAGRADLAATLAALSAAEARGVPVGDLVAATQARRVEVDEYGEAYRRYCWATSGLDGLKLAPFHLLAAGASAWFDRDHAWHLDRLDRLADADPDLIVPTPRRIVRLADDAAVHAATAWWAERTAAGMEGMVVKPLGFVAIGPKGLLQPAIKVRGQSYLRIIYGPEYLLPANLDRLRVRHLGRKQGLALREFALGAEALERFTRNEPLHRVHECIAGILTLEAEVVDPRL